MIRHGSSGRSSAGGSGLRRGQVGSRDEHDLGLGLGGRELAGVALVADDQLGLGDGEPPAQVVGAQLLRAREGDGAQPEARDHGEHPLGPVAHQGHHDVAPSDPARGERAGGARALLRDLTHAPDAPFAIAPERDEGASVGRGRVDDIPGEVHGR